MCGVNPKSALASHAFLASSCDGVVRERWLEFSNSVDAVGMGPSPRVEQPTQNMYRQGESDCLFKTKHCDGPDGCLSNIYERRTTAKAFAKDVLINQEGKLGAQRRSYTVLVSTKNDADQGSADDAFRTPPAPYEKSKFSGFWGSIIARLKLKGIDVKAPPGVEPAA
ncbi:hypothetical protein MTR67_012438 [Solanum verrucosum]|uniref:Uncharacterized protein n=1 Tax=Solanum verrucosum TaxID=315347 RepID=A0AAF0QAC7_SOLVR|nr:hypothetical protein MTR67_012438 [Solanum verrucosum]